MNNLLPCPFCGGEGELCYERHDIDDWQVSCKECGAVSCPVSMRFYETKGAIDDWNTRIVNGHRVTFYWEKPGVISPTSVWLVSHKGYLYGPCDKWEDVEKLVRDEWENDRNLVGFLE